MVIDPIYHKIIIQDERDSINFYARSIGVWQQMIQKEMDDIQRQYFQYFMDVDIIELENANERLERYRGELTNYELQHRIVPAV